MQSNLIVWIKLYIKCLSVNAVTGDFWFDTDEKWGGRGDRESIKISGIYQPQFNLHHKFKCQPMKMLQLE